MAGKLPVLDSSGNRDILTEAIAPVPATINRGQPLAEKARANIHQTRTRNSIKSLIIYSFDPDSIYKGGIAFEISPSKTGAIARANGITSLSR